MNPSELTRIEELEPRKFDVDWESLEPTGKDCLQVEQEGKLAQREVDTQRFWWITQPAKVQEPIIRRAFEEAHPTNDDKRRAAKEFEEAGG